MKDRLDNVSQSEATRFIGRAHEIQALREIITSGEGGP